VPRGPASPVRGSFLRRAGGYCWIVPEFHPLERDADEISRAAVERLYTLRPQLVEFYGPKGKARCVEDMAHHVRHLAIALWAGEPELFADYAAWATRVMTAYGVETTHIRASLEALNEIVRTRLDELDADAAGACIGAAIALGPGEEPACEITDAGPHARLAREYLDALLIGSRESAASKLKAAVAQGVPLLEVYVHVLLPVQREVGRLWQKRAITVAQEHFCTHTTQQLMSHLAIDLLYVARPTLDLRAIVFCPGGERHSLGCSAFADLLEARGWSVRCLGADTPVRTVAEEAAAFRPHLLALSVCTVYGVRAATEAVESCRGLLPRLRVIAGGRMITGYPGLAGRLGADMSAADLAEGLELVQEQVRPFQ